MEDPSVLNSASIPVSDQAGTSHATGDDLISHEAYYPNGREAHPTLPSTNQQNHTKVVEHEISNVEVFGPGYDNSDIRGHNVGYGLGDEDSVDTAWSESTTVPRRNLGFVQITSLMLNTTIGSGIFNTPGYVLALTRSKRVSLILWAVGGVYSALSMLIFLEYGTALPYNGGALIYLDEVFHRPRLLATVIFSCFWILLASTCTSSKSVAVNILAVANPNTDPSDLSDGQIRFTAIVVQSVSCLLLFFARRVVFVFNSTFAVYKIILLLFIFITGMANSRGENSGWKDFNENYPGYRGIDTLTAMIYIIFSYQGWDNANYIAGEIRNCKKTLRLAGITSILIITCLYMLATLAFYAVADYATLTNDDGQNNSALQFATMIFGSSTGMKVAITLSAFSDQIFATYTTAKVKQAIAWQRIIPFYKFFGRQNVEFDSPGGALLLHWIFTFIPLVFLNTRSDTRGFFLGIYSYGYQVMWVFLGIGILRLKGRMQLLRPNWKPMYMPNFFVLGFVAVVFVSFNIVILAVTAMPEDPDTIPRFYWPVTIVGVMAFGIIYWSILRIFQVSEHEDSKASSISSKLGLKINVYEEGDENVPIEMRFLMRDAVGDGSRRRLDYKVSGPVSQCKIWLSRFKATIFKYLGY